MSQAQIAASLREGIELQQKTLALMVPSIATLARLLSNTLKQGHKILLMGNGGSAAGAQHFAAELVGRFEQERRPLAAIALTADTSILTAIANDYGYEHIFARQIEGLGQPGDVVIGLSTSGNSANILAGVKTAKVKGLTAVGLTGEGGGKLADMCDLVLPIPSTRTARIQEMHTTIAHVLCEVIEQDLAESFEPSDSLGKAVSSGPDSSKLRQLNPPMDVYPHGQSNGQVGTIKVPQPERSSDASTPKYQPTLGIAEKLRQIKLLILDFDGVLTDNRVLVTQTASEGVLCHRGDGWGIARLRERGLEILVLSTEPNPVVQARCQKLKINCIHGCNDKLAALRRLAEERSITLGQIGYVGNDVNDLACMQQVGVPMAVADAVPEIHEVACCITTQRGGYGAVREVADWIRSAHKAPEPQNSQKY